MGLYQISELEFVRGIVNKLLFLVHVSYNNVCNWKQVGYKNKSVYGKTHNISFSFCFRVWMGE